MIHWDRGIYVQGFLVPNMKDEKEALKALKKSFIICKIKIIERKNEIDPYRFTSELNRIKEYLKALKRPWRLNNRSNSLKSVRIIELILPTESGYWLKDIMQNKTLCNIH